MSIAISGSTITFADLTTQSSAPVVFKNYIYNGDMRIDQRNAGASQTFTAGAALEYSVDRFYGFCTGGNVTGQRIAGTAPNEFAYQFTVSSASNIGFGTRLEATNTIGLAGSDATFSVQLANSQLTTVTWALFYASTTDSFGTVATPTRTQIGTGTFTVTPTLTTYSATVAIPLAAVTGLEILFTVGPQTSGTWTIGNVQLESGLIASTFERRPIGTELALCQRYFQTIPAVRNGSTSTGVIVNPMFSISTRIPLPLFPVQMRANPTITTFRLAGTNPGQITEFSSGTNRTITSIIVVDACGGGFMQSSTSFSDPPFLNLKISAEL
jgi:hypothetical protein